MHVIKSKQDGRYRYGYTVPGGHFHVHSAGICGLRRGGRGSQSGGGGGTGDGAVDHRAGALLLLLSLGLVSFQVLEMLSVCLPPLRFQLLLPLFLQGQ